MRKEIRIFGVILGGDAVTYTINCADYNVVITKPCGV